MAHKKGSGSAKNGRDSNSQRLGIKKFGGEHVIPGNIIVRQRGTKFHPGAGTKLGGDYTLYAITEGVVTFEPMRGDRKRISVYPVNAAAQAPQPIETVPVPGETSPVETAADIG